VQMIVRDLDNEKIDIVPYSPISENFITSALNPAQIVSIKLSNVERRATVVVERDSLAKAIGKRGQNAKLAAKLTGWKIDISEQEEAETLARMEGYQLQYLQDFLVQVEGLPEIARAAIAKSMDFNSVEKLADKEPRELLNFTGDNTELAERIIAGAQEYLEGLREMTISSDVDANAELSPEAAEFLKNADALANRLAGKVVSFSPEDEALADAEAAGEPAPE